MKKSLVVVTGGAGFVGSHLCERLLGMGHEVLAIDDLSTGHRKHVAHLQAHAGFRLALHDITRSLPREAREAQCIYNLACPASPTHYRSAPVQTTLTSVVGAWQVLELAARTGARVLQVSTSDVYGDPLEHPQTEAYWGHVNPLGPRACYDEGKRCAETLCMAYGTERNIDVRIARLFNTYGPRLRPDDGRVVSNFIVQALRGHPLTVYGDGRQTRSFCYVSDTVDGLLKLMDSEVQGPVNIGSADERTVIDLAQLVLELTSSHSAIVRRPLPADDARRRRPDIARARAMLDWWPRVDLTEGLRHTIDYFRRELDLPAGRGAHRLASTGAG